MRIERFEWDRDPIAHEMAARLRALVPGPESVADEVREILAQVREGGVEALGELAERFGEPAPRRVTHEEIDAASDSVPPEVLDALEVARRNIEATARAEIEAMEIASRPAVAELPEGQRVEVRATPIEIAGIYAPGGRAAYPSSVLMCGVPAAVAGVPVAIVATPAGPDGLPSPAVLAATGMIGCEEVDVWMIGGAQAIGAMAYGTSVDEDLGEPADVIVGPGSRYVTEAKRQVTGAVGIDGLAGPTELLVILGDEARPDWIALDLCAQAEHGEDSLLIVASPSFRILNRVARGVAEIAAERPSVADAVLALVKTASLEAAYELAAELGPEHLEVGPQPLSWSPDWELERVPAGCVVRGFGGATAFCDYVAGSNHVLPTGGAARSGGPLGPGVFLNRTSHVFLPQEAAVALTPHVEALARAEGFPVHAESARARTEGPESEPRTEEELARPLGERTPEELGWMDLKR